MEQANRPGTNRVCILPADFKGSIKEEAQKYYEENEDNFLYGKKQTEEEIKAGTTAVVSKVSLSDTSVYDTAFWMFFYEENPLIQN